MPRRNIKKLTFKKRRFSRKKLDVWKRRKKRSSKRGYRFNAPETLLPTLFPKSKTVTLYYRTRVELSQNGTPGFIGQHVFRLNSIYDPDYTGTGTQPRGHDELAARYGQYIVNSALVKVTFTSAGSGNNYPCKVGIGMDKDATLASSTSRDDLIEHQLGRYMGTLLPNSREKVVIKGMYKRNEFFKKEAGSDRNDQVTDFGSNATPAAYLQVWNAAKAALTTAVQAEVEIWYRVTVSEPLGISQS